jgi:hypothetical protein
MPSQNKRVTHYCRLHAVGGKIHTQMCSNNLMRVSVPAEDGSHNRQPSHMPIKYQH